MSEDPLWAGQAAGEFPVLVCAEAGLLRVQHYRLTSAPVKARPGPISRSLKQRECSTIRRSADAPLRANCRHVAILSPCGREPGAHAVFRSSCDNSCRAVPGFDRFYGVDERLLQNALADGPQDEAKHPPLQVFALP